MKKIPSPLLIISDPSLSYLQRRELVRVMIEQATYSQKQLISPRQFYRHLDIAYMNPDKVNEILSGKLKINVNDLFQIVQKNQI